MVNFKIVAVEVFAILVAGLMLNLPTVMATDINIYFNGDKKLETEFHTDNLINSEIDFIHEANDILWKNVKVAVRLNSASLAKEVKKIYLYKCKTLSPVNCVQTEPQVFDNFIDVELLWNDVSSREGKSAYPQVANLMIMVKLEDLSGGVSWLGMWKHMRRTGYNTFTEYGPEINEIDLHANSADMVDPIKMYVDNFGMVPFEWLTKAVFKGSNSLYALGAGESEIETTPPNFLTASPSTSEITTINKDYYFIFPNTSSGVANPMTLNINPSFDCGDGTCESYLGETPNTCCIDCPCGNEEYCDVDPDVPNFAQCKTTDDVSLQVLSTSAPLVTDCSNTFDLNITLKVNNPPSSLPDTISSTFKIGSEAYPATCYGGPEYYCPVSVNSPVDCGQGTFELGPNEVTASIIFTDGSNDKSLTLVTEFPDVTVNHECECDINLYCDTGSYKCRSEEAITLGITSLTSYLDDYDDGDPIELTAKIFNPPTGLTVISTSATLNLTGGHVSPGSPTCTGPSDDYEYNCSIPFQISGYSNDQSYTFDPNNLIFTITYLDGSIEKTKVLETNFGPVSIPSQFCGDGTCNMGETQESCCMDCGCSGPDDYCDAVSGCAPESGVTLSAAAVSPVEMTDCKVPHVVNITLNAVNSPSTLTLDNYYHISDNLPTGWNIQCDDSGYGGVFYCHLTVPAIDGCELPSYDIDNNKLNVTMSFDNGASASTFYERITKQVTVEFSDLSIIPIYHCGDGTCESDLGEGPGNCCLDCACSGTQYCDVTPEGTGGSCKSKDAIKLIVDSPKATVRLTSCEVSHHVNIKAHVQGQPKTMQPEQYFGTFNGSNAEMIHCNVESAYGATTNQSFNCTLTVPSQFVCEKGEDYIYKDNSFSIMISYNNGGITETKTLSATLPNIVVTQTIESLHDIMRVSEEKLKETLKNIMDKTEKMFKAYEKCMSIAKLVAFAAVIATLVTVGIGVKNKWSADDFRHNVKMVGEISSKAVQTITNICQLIVQYHQIGLTLEKIKMDMVRVQVCTKLNQHMLDSGQCIGREESCFNSLIGCMNLANVDNWMNSITSITRQMSQTASNIGNTYSNFMSDYGAGTYADRRVNLLVKCGNEYMRPSGECCSHVSGKSTCGIGEKIYIRAEKTGYSSSSCNYPVIMLNGRNPKTGIHYSDHVIDILGSAPKKEAIFTLHCYRSPSDYANAMSTGKVKNPTKIFTVNLINDDKCKNKCGDGSGSDLTPGAPVVTSFTVNGKTEIKVGKYDKVTFEAKIKDDKDGEIKWNLENGAGKIIHTGKVSGCFKKECVISDLIYTYATDGIETGTHTAKFWAIDDSTQKSNEKTVTVTVTDGADSAPKILSLSTDKTVYINIDKITLESDIIFTTEIKQTDGKEIKYQVLIRSEDPPFYRESGYKTINTGQYTDNTCKITKGITEIMDIPVELGKYKFILNTFLSSDESKKDEKEVEFEIKKAGGETNKDPEIVEFERQEGQLDWRMRIPLTKLKISVATVEFKLTIRDTDGEKVNYEIDWGDSTILSSILEKPAIGSVDTSKCIDYTCTEDKIIYVFDHGTTYNSRVKVTDSHGSTNEFTKTHKYDPCFLPGTKISTPYGDVNIENIESGDEVISYNEYLDENQVSNVDETFNHDYDQEYLIINGFLKVTTNHPIWINGEWVEAGSATLGDKLRDINSNDVTIESIEIMDDANTVYNLDVGLTHTFYADSILVHNKDCFIEGTQILMADGTAKNIEDIMVGDLIKTFNTKTMEIENKPVMALLSSLHSGQGNDITVIVRLSDGTENQNTNTHPYYVKSKGWASYEPELTKERYGIEVGLLEIGDIVYEIGDTGGLTEVEVTDIVEVYEPVRTYNLMKIMDNNNFFANNVLVHNKIYDDDCKSAEKDNNECCETDDDKPWRPSDCYENEFFCPIGGPECGCIEGTAPKCGDGFCDASKCETKDNCEVDCGGDSKKCNLLSGGCSCCYVYVKEEKYDAYLGTTAQNICRGLNTGDRCVVDTIGIARCHDMMNCPND